jgi:RNA polymerase subunit RPABC4/transcription elongation factor Spt4
MLLEAIAAGVVAAALLWLVLQPMVFPSASAPIDLDPLDPEETPQGQALIALKEIEFDRATGKLSDDDYAELNARYSAAAIAAIDAPAVTVRCLTHGVRLEPDARFCPACGAGLVTDSEACAGCGFMIPVDAVFCPGCGVELQSGVGSRES